MSKNKNNKNNNKHSGSNAKPVKRSTEQQAATGENPKAQQVPGRTLGFVIMSVLIVGVAFFMQQQSTNLGNSANTASALYNNALPGFRVDAWHLPDDDLFGFVPIPAGAFTMGSNPALDRMAYQNEQWSRTQRQGQPQLPLYYIAKFETTRAQYAAFTRDTGRFRNAFAESDTGLPGNLPMTNVNWPEALAYARWLDEQLRNSNNTPEQLKVFLESGAKVTLPNEAEWEKAARSTDGRMFPWGSRPRNNLANIGNDEPVPVGSIDCEECAYGLSDMAGNVWELTRSLMQDYPFDPSIDKVNLQPEPLYVMRGGAFSDEINNARAAVRGAVDPGVRNDTIGFRVVISSQ